MMLAIVGVGMGRGTIATKWKNGGSNRCES